MGSWNAILDRAIRPKLSPRPMVSRRWHEICRKRDFRNPFAVRHGTGGGAPWEHSTGPRPARKGARSPTTRKTGQRGRPLRVLASKGGVLLRLIPHVATRKAGLEHCRGTIGNGNRNLETGADRTAIARR